MRYIFPAIFLIFSYQSVVAQKTYKTDSKKAIEYYQAGLRYYDGKRYDLAEERFKTAISIDEEFQDAYLVIAEVFWEQGKYEPAIQYYDKGLSLDPSYYPIGYLNKAKLEVKIGNYDEANKSYHKYLELDTPESKYTLRAKKGILQTEFAIHAINNPVDFKPINLGGNINSVHDEYWPVLSADEQVLVITRKLPSKTGSGFQSDKQEDLYFSRYEAGGWGPVKDAGHTLNTDANEGAQSVSANGQIMVYTVCDEARVIGRCDIYYSTKVGDKWTRPKNIGPPVNSRAKETQPSLSADGMTLYFASNRPGGKGGLDIWVSKKDSKNRWGSPVNLGDSINTPGDEMSPFIHHDNKTFYFSSNYHIGMGNFDLFVSRLDSNGHWSIPKNLGYPINTHEDEIGLVVNARGTEAYFASARNDSTGIDIYKFTLPEKIRPKEVSYLKGRIIDEKTRERLKARLELIDLKDGKLINQTYSDSITGEYLLCIPTDNDYMLNVNRRDYLFYSDNFTLRGIYHLEKPFLKDILLKRIQIGEKLILKNIFYNTDSYALGNESIYELDKIYHFLKAHEVVRIEISGHTDNTGTRSYNQKLSEKRAKSVVDYLIDKGIDASRLVYRGYGFDHPVDENDTEEGRAKNRRTELKIIHSEN